MTCQTCFGIGRISVCDLGKYCSCPDGAVCGNAQSKPCPDCTTATTEMECFDMHDEIETVANTIGRTRRNLQARQANRERQLRSGKFFCVAVVFILAIVCGVVLK